MNSKLNTASGWPLYPLLFAVYIPLNLFAHNLSLYSANDALRAFIFLPLLVGLLVALLFFIVRRLHFAALVTVLLIIYGVYFYSGTIADIPILLGLLAICGLAYKVNIGARATRLLNLLALAMAVQPLFIIATESISIAAVSTLDNSPFNEVKPTAGFEQKTPPTIVHIVLDAYNSNETLRELFNYDNTPFSDELADMGFIVGQDVRTPYNQTLLVMTSIFNGTYLEPGRGPLSVKTSDHLRGVLGKLTTQGPLYQRLKEKGYNFLFVEPGYEFLGRPESATLSGPDVPAERINYFEQELLNFLFRLTPLHRLESVEIYKNIYLKNALTTEFYLTEERPYLLYEHIIAPHPPFVIDRNGNDTDQWEKFNTLATGNHATYGLPHLAEEYKEGYREKLMYTNDGILKQLRKMIRDIQGPKIILLHGDHGSGAYYYHEFPEFSCLSERYNTFLAVYSDDPAVQEKFSSLPSERFNLVNIYRLIFDASFGTELGTLQDKSYFARWSTPQEPMQLPEIELAGNCPALKPYQEKPDGELSEQAIP
jgi:hypothetical protein